MNDPASAPEGADHTVRPAKAEADHLPSVRIATALAALDQISAALFDLDGADEVERHRLCIRALDAVDAAEAALKEAMIKGIS